MSAYVLHDNGDPKSIANGTPPSPVPNGWTATTITDAEFTGLTTGPHRWDPPTRTVVADTSRTQAATNQQAIRDALIASMPVLQAIINTAQVNFSNVTGSLTAMRTQQTQLKDAALVLRRLIRLATDDYSGTS